MIRHDREVGDNVGGCAFDVLQGWICFFEYVKRLCSE